MTPQEAAEIIRDHTQWRKTNKIVDIPFALDMPYSPVVVGEAIDALLKYYHETQSIKKEHEEHS
jgi:hypothetical protein